MRGDAAGLDPSPYFATRWYKTRYPDWADQGAATALEDFVAPRAQGAGRQPHPLIDPDWYLARYPDLAGYGADVTLHFLRHGDAEGRAPSPDFDAAFYARCYLPLGQGHPFRHYVTEGASRGFLARPLTRPLARDTAASARAMRQALAGLARPVLLVAHDAQRAGVPILTLDLAQGLRARGHDPLFLLDRAGPLLDRFRSAGPVLILSEGWDLAGLAAGMPAALPVLVNTAAAARIGHALARAGRPGLILVHEMADYLTEQGLLPDLAGAAAAGARLIVSMPRMVDQMRPLLGSVDQLLPGVPLPPTPLAAFRQRRALRGAGPVFISAGHADRRKGFDLFLSAASLIAQAEPKARFVWLGALDPWAQDLAQAALAKGLPLILPGFVSDSLAWYRAADAYLLTSRQDPGPTTVIQAAAMGTPFLAYAADIGLIGLTDQIGQFWPPEDAPGFAAAALDLAARSTPARRRALRRHVRARISLDAYLSGLLSRLVPAPDGAA